MNKNHPFDSLYSIYRTSPIAWARLRGSLQYPQIMGMVRFYEHPYGVLVLTELQGLPNTQNACASSVFGFHIHGGGSCTGTSDDPFADSQTHYNPKNCPHPYHAGDLPPIFSASGHAFSAVLTERFTISEIIGKTVILHSLPDDFTTQPSGNAGSKIACGEIMGRVRQGMGM